MPGEIFLNDMRHFHILHIGKGRLHISNELREDMCLSRLSRLQGTRFGQMHFVSQPGSFSLFACSRFWVRGGTHDPLVCVGLGTCSPFCLPARQVIILLPDLAQHMNTGLVLEMVRSIGL